MTAERHGDFGSKLRAARERRGISVRDIANATKISVSVIEALERNDISRLPGGIFSRAFVRSYAVEVGVDPEQAIEDFIAQFPHDSVTAGHPQARQQEDHEAVESERRTASTFLKIIAISLPIAGVVLYYGTAGRPAPARPAQGQVQSTSLQQGGPHAPAIVDPAPPQPAMQAPVAAQSTQPIAPPSEAAAAGQDRVTVEIVAVGRCSVAATVDGVPSGERMLGAGDHESFEARRDLQLKIGDAAAIRWTINGEPARPLGPAGQVANVHLTPATYKDYVTSR